MTQDRIDIVINERIALDLQTLYSCKTWGDKPFNYAWDPAKTTVNSIAFHAEVEPVNYTDNWELRVALNDLSFGSFAPGTGRRTLDVTIPASALKNGANSFHFVYCYGIVYWGSGSALDVKNTYVTIDYTGDPPSSAPDLWQLIGQFWGIVGPWVPLIAIGAGLVGGVMSFGPDIARSLRSTTRSLRGSFREEAPRYYPPYPPPPY